jgi:hypothetical protein
MVDFYSLNIDDAEYKSMISLFRTAIKKVGDKAMTQDAARNIVYWITFEMSSAQYLFQMTGNSIDVFNRYYTIGSIASEEGVCDIPHSSTLDGGNHNLRMEYSYSEYNATSACMDAGDPSTLGFSSNYDYDTFRIDIDLNSLIIAVAVGTSHIINLEYMK